MSINRLAEETSPYLLAHKDNPVHWYAWGEDALKAAEETGKPILLSIGYTACHWCHVMSQESFTNPETAAQINDNFIPVLVDREERPEVDKYFQTAAQLMGHNGGWPLTMFLTTKAAPFFVGGYFPATPVGNQPAFSKVLEDVRDIYTNQAEQVAGNSTQVIEALHKQWTQDRSGQIDPRMLEAQTIHTAQRFDMFYGGLTGAPKFPRTMSTELIWRGFLRTGAPQYAQLTETTLRSICLSSVYDHIGGGFHRYAMDERWMVPHFEKMSSDSAAMVDILTLVYQHTHELLYRSRIEETLAWLNREMLTEEAFATSLDSDTNGIEGNYYLWTEEEIDAALAGTFAQRFKEVFQIQKQGQLNGRNFLQRLNAPYPLSDADEAMLNRQLSLLQKARQENRTQPKRDDKILASVNGMVIHAFATAGLVFANPAWLKTAVTAFDFIVKNMNTDGRLSHSWCGGKPGPAGLAEDYAQMARAAICLWEATSEKRFLEHAKNWTAVMNTQFWDSEHGGYFETAADQISVLERIRSALDQDMPNANAVMLDVLAKLTLISGETDLVEKTNMLIRSFTRELQGSSFISMPSFFCHLENVYTGLQIVIVGPRSHPQTQELINAVLGRSLPTRLMMLVDPEETLPQGHPAFGKKMEDNQPTAYICQHNACMAPITNAQTLSQVLQLPTQPQQGRPQ